MSLPSSQKMITPPLHMENDDDYSSISEDGNQFSVLSESDIKHLQNNDINHILSILLISRPLACLLLTNYNWNTTQVLESWFDNLQKVQKTIGLSNQHHLESGFQNSSQTLTMCDICFETFSRDEIRSSWCGHPFCINCWNQYVDINIDDLNCFKLRCPQPSCNAAVDQDMIHQLASKSRKIKYDQFFFRSYVENNSDRKLKWCPAPNCCCAISYDQLSESSSRLNYDVTCHCYHSFCWNCGEEAHTPVDCETFVKWRRKIGSDSEVTNNNWIIANTKPCPNCKIAIEKNQGCRHMRCRLCKFSFCWLCLRDMSICMKKGCSGTLNNVQVWHYHQEIYDDEMQRTNAKNCLDKYTYYEILRKKALQNLIEMNSTAYIKSLGISWIKTDTYFDFIKDALKQLVECRRVLKWAYVYGYYLPENENARIEFFEHIESIAQVALERLRHCAESELRKVLHDGSEEEFCDFRLKLITLTRVAKSYFMNLVSGLENGLDVVCVKNYTGVKRALSEIDDDSYKKLNTGR